MIAGCGGGTRDEARTTDDAATETGTMQGETATDTSTAPGMTADTAQAGPRIQGDSASPAEGVPQSDSARVTSDSGTGAPQ